MSSKLRFVSVLLVAALTVIAGSAMVAPRISAQAMQTFQSRQVNGATVNLGAITMNGAPPYTPLPAIAGWLPGSYPLTYTPAAGYYFVRWESSIPAITFSNPNMNPTTVTLAAGVSGGTITAVYQQIGQLVGGVVLPTNTFMSLTPYLALIGLVATVAVASRRKRVY